MKKLWKKMLSLNLALMLVLSAAWIVVGENISLMGDESEEITPTFSLNTKSVRLAMNGDQSFQLIATKLTDAAINIEWNVTADPEGCVTVEAGLLQAVKSGSATVIAYDLNSGYSVEASVIVKDVSMGGIEGGSSTDLYEYSYPDSLSVDGKLVGKESGQYKSGSGWSYDFENNILTLTNYNGGPILASGDLVVHTFGNVTVKGQNLPQRTGGNMGIFTSGGLHLVASSGNLTVLGANNARGGGYPAVLSDDDMSIEVGEGVTARFTGGNATGSTNSGNGGDAIKTYYGNILLNGKGKLYANGGNAAGTNSTNGRGGEAVESGYSYGIDVYLNNELKGGSGYMGGTALYYGRRGAYFGVVSSILQGGSGSYIGFARDGHYRGSLSYSEHLDAQMNDDETRIVFTPKKYTLTLNGQGGKYGGKSSLSYTNSCPYEYDLSQYSFSKSGYILAGWSESTDSDVIYVQADAKYAPLDNITLYAVWKKPFVIVTSAEKTSSGSRYVWQASIIMPGGISGEYEVSGSAAIALLEGVNSGRSFGEDKAFLAEYSLSGGKIHSLNRSNVRSIGYSSIDENGVVNGKKISTEIDAFCHDGKAWQRFSFEELNGTMIGESEYLMDSGNIAVILMRSMPVYRSVYAIVFQAVKNVGNDGGYNRLYAVDSEGWRHECYIRGHEADDLLDTINGGNSFYGDKAFLARLDLDKTGCVVGLSTSGIEKLGGVIGDDGSFGKYNIHDALVFSASPGRTYSVKVYDWIDLSGVYLKAEDTYTYAENGKLKLLLTSESSMENPQTVKKSEEALDFELRFWPNNNLVGLHYFRLNDANLNAENMRGIVSLYDDNGKMLGLFYGNIRNGNMLIDGGEISIDVNETNGISAILIDGNERPLLEKSELTLRR